MTNCFLFFFRRASFFACCLDKHLYVIGGRNETGYLSSVEAYNLETNEWNYVSSLPQPLAAHAGAVHNGKIYISGESVIKPSQDSFVLNKYNLKEISGWRINCAFNKINNRKYQKSTDEQ